jgi:hypothetical protein
VNEMKKKELIEKIRAAKLEYDYAQLENPIGYRSFRFRVPQQLVRRR